jgi:hypothetical protein
MPIVRGHHSFDDKFTQIPNAWLRDSRLSLKSIGLLAQLMSHEPGWQLSVNSLAYANQVGKDAIRSAVAELEEFGYLNRVQTREEGKFAETIWYTQDPASPGDNSGPSGNPSSDYPTSDIPQVKNNINKNNNLRINTPKVKDFEAVFDEFWNHYPRKTDKLAAKRALGKILNQSPELEALIIEGVKRLGADPNLPEARFIKHPATWLHAGGWENEPYPERPVSPEIQEKELAEYRARKREQDRARTQALLQEGDERAKAATPPPKCIHGNSIVSCLPCLKNLQTKRFD